MSIFTWWRELRDAQRKVAELQAVEQQKLQDLKDAIQENPDLDASTMCAALDSITISVKGTDRAKKKG